MKVASSHALKARCEKNVEYEMELLLAGFGGQRLGHAHYPGYKAGGVYHGTH
jgi:hypothetical protein